MVFSLPTLKERYYFPFHHKIEFNISDSSVLRDEVRRRSVGAFALLKRKNHGVVNDKILNIIISP